ncbi:MAG: aromatic-ring-hydroxylating dioxygenase subunit beta [Pseudomonadota bacterium]|nr:aromatic-ring-hydroxylating dioxygenase subunit beta [Pseudomonadota bacterium]
MKIPTDVREALSDLMAEYALSIDENRLEDWVELFDEACDYKVVTRENVEQGLPNVLMWCDNKNMLRDRVESYRHVNLYNPHYDRHVLGPLRFTEKKNPAWCFDVPYSLFQTELEGASRLFSVGRYRAEAVVEGGAARLKSVMVIADTGLIPSLLATPI